MRTDDWPPGYRMHRVAHIPLGIWCYAVTPEGRHLEPCRTESDALQSAINHEGTPAQPGATEEKARQNDLF